MYGEEKDYKYFVRDGEMCRVSIETDDWPDNPREWDGNVGEMCCECRHYTLGDRQEVDSFDLKSDMIKAAGITEKQIIKAIKDGKCKGEGYADGLWLKYDRHERMWNFGMNNFHEVINMSADLDWLYDDMVEYLSIQDIIDISKGEIVALNLYLYDHSGISMDCRSFVGRIPYAEWDSGCVGFIWTTLAKVKEVTGQNFKTKKEWQAYAEEELKAEVRIYDQYIENDCYCIREEMFDKEEQDWSETECCGGFYPSEPYHYEEILAENYGQDFKFYDTEEAARQTVSGGIDFKIYPTSEEKTEQEVA